MKVSGSERSKSNKGGKQKITEGGKAVDEARRTNTKEAPKEKGKALNHE